MVKFQPMTKEQASRTLPTGEYDAVVEGCVAKKSKKNNADMFEVKLRVYGDKEVIVSDYLLCEGEMAFRLRHFCEAIGKLEDYESGELYPETFSGSNVRVKLKYEEAGEFPEKNSVKSYVLKRKTEAAGSPQSSGKSPRKPPAAVQQGANLPDEIPF